MVLIHTDFNFPSGFSFWLLYVGIKLSTDYLFQTTWSGGHGKDPRLSSCLQLRRSQALLTTLRKCALSTCTGDNSCIHVFKGIQYQIVRDGEEMRDPFGERRGKFQWKALSEKLAMLRENNPQWFIEESNSWSLICEVNLCVCRERVRILAVKIVNSAIPEKTLH